MLPAHVIYDNDADGFCSAWVVRQKYPTANLIEIPHGTDFLSEELMEQLAGDRVFIADLEFDRTQLIRLASVCELQLFDHHPTAEERLGDLEFTYYDTTKAACMITWEQLFPGKPAPKLVEYVQDSDTWSWKLEGSRAVTAYIYNQEFDLEIWDDIARMLEEDYIDGGLDYILTVGLNLEKQRNHITEELARNASWIELEGYVVPYVCCPRSLVSETGNFLCKGQPFAVLWYVNDKGQISYSMRSDNQSEDSVDVSVIASKHGGGGHRHAAGYKPKSPPKEVIK